MSETACICTMTNPETWLSAASCGYGSGYEPGSQWEWNPDCPEHPPWTATNPVPPADDTEGRGGGADERGGVAGGA